MPLKVSDGMSTWIKDFQKSDAPQFKGKDKEERREMAIAAYLSAKRGDQKEDITIADVGKSLSRSYNKMMNPVRRLRHRAGVGGKGKKPFPPKNPNPSYHTPKPRPGELNRNQFGLMKNPSKFTRNEEVELGEKYSWNDVNKALTKANYMRGNPAEISKVASKFDYKSGNDKKFSLKDIKKNLSAAGVDASRQYNVMKHFKEDVDPSDTGGSEEISMAMRQLEAMEHFIEGIEERLKKTGDMEEWYQNKLTKAHDYLKTLYSYGKGDDDDDDDLDEALDPNTRIKIHKHDKDGYHSFISDVKAGDLHKPSTQDRLKRIAAKHGTARLHHNDKLIGAVKDNGTFHAHPKHKDLFKK